MIPVRLMRAGRLPVYLAGAALLYMMLMMIRASGNSIIGINISGDIHLTGQQVQSLRPGEDEDYAHGHASYQEQRIDEDGPDDDSATGTGSLDADELPVNPFAHRGNCPTGESMRGYNDDHSWNRSSIILVVASVKRFGYEWIAKELKDWPSLIYMADDPDPPPPLTHPGRNKGNEANVYLRYIIEHYHDLPEVMVFMHGHRDSLHIDLGFGSNYATVRRLNLDHVRRIGYQSLNCGHEYICRIDRKARVWGPTDKHTKAAWPILFPNDPIPPKTLYGPPYAQFAVSKQRVLRNAKSDYERMHRWLMDTPISDWDSGRVFEYSWAYIFGYGNFYCVERDECMCEGYGLCDLKAHMSEVGFPEDPEIERRKQRKLEEEAARTERDRKQTRLKESAATEKEQADSIFGKALLNEVQRKVGHGKGGNKRNDDRGPLSDR